MTKPTGRINPRWGGQWTILADEMIHSYYGLYTAAQVAERINARCNTKFTAGAIYDRAEYLGISASGAQGLLTVSDAARQVGLTRSLLAKYLDRHPELETIGQSHRYLTEKTWQIIQGLYPVLGDDWMRAYNAARELHYATCTIVKWIETGQLEGRKRGAYWYVRITDIERLQRLQQGRARIGDK